MESQLITSAAQPIPMYFKLQIVQLPRSCPIACVTVTPNLPQAFTRASIPSFGPRIARLGSGGAEHVISTANVESWAKWVGADRSAVFPKPRALESRPTADGRCLVVPCLQRA